MNVSRSWREVVLSDAGILVLLAVAILALHTVTNTQYGFHRDELGMLADAHYLDWGFVSYPPLTPAIARVAVTLFGASLPGVRFFSALAQAVVFVVVGLMAKELGGRRPAQIVAALAVAIAPVSFVMSTLFEYVSFDYMWWVLIAYFIIRLLRTDDPRWWLAIGAAIGLGMMTKYTIAFYVAGIVAAVLLTPARRYLTSRWLWAGAALSLILFLPNLIWQVQHGFISLQFLQSIHARDINIGRADNFIVDQLRLAANPFTIPLWIAGLYYCFFSADGKRYRMIGWMAIVTVALYMVSQGRGYYTAGVFPMLLAAGAVAGERWLGTLSTPRRRLVVGVNAALMAVGTVVVAALGPYAPVNSEWWKVSSDLNSDLKEEIGWPELVETVAGTYNRLPPAERSQAGIIARNYGEAGAIELYGPAYGLPHAISGIDSFWARGYGDPPPTTLVVVGYPMDSALQLMSACEVGGRITNAYGVDNEEMRGPRDILICRGMKMSWPEFWAEFQSFG